MCRLPAANTFFKVEVGDGTNKYALLVHGNDDYAIQRACRRLDPRAKLLRPYPGVWGNKYFSKQFTSIKNAFTNQLQANCLFWEQARNDKTCQQTKKNEALMFFDVCEITLPPWCVA